MFYNRKFSKNTKEFLFQIALHILVLVFYSSDHRHTNISLQEFVYFLNYATAAFVVNYVLLPRYLYPKKYPQFLIGLSIVVACLILIEELVLEKIFFPTTRAQGFPGLYFTLVEVLPVLVVLSGFKFAWDALNKQKELEVLKSAVQESELQFLKSQINPHFLFNNLNNLYAYAIENSPKTPELILGLSGVLRYMLYECKENFVPLKKEVEQLHNFIKISELQVEDRGTVQFSVGQILENYSIAPLILTVFIENAFKHSTASQSDGIELFIHLEMNQSGVLCFSCQNSFLALSNTDNLTHGIGLENVQKRLQLLYPEKHCLEIKKTENTFLVQLELELHKTA